MGGLKCLKMTILCNGYRAFRMSSYQRNEERILKLIRKNREITVEEVARKLNVSIGSAYVLIHDSPKFGKKKVGTTLEKMRRKER